jgi:predicted phage tail protein
MPTEAPNTLRSRAKFNIVDIISQGPTKGIVNGAQSIYLDDTPIQNADGSYNFPNFDVTRDVTELPVVLPTGSTATIYPGIFPASENTVNVGVKVTKNSPEGSGSGDGSVTRTITDDSLDSARVTLRIPALAVTNTTTGDITGGNIQFQIYVTPNGGSPISIGTKWIPLAAPDAETSSVARGILSYITTTRIPNQAMVLSWQYAKKTGSTWGDWVEYSTLIVPATSSSSSSSGYYKEPTTRTYERYITGLPAGVYKARTVITGGSLTPLQTLEAVPSVLSITGKTVSPYDVSYNVPLPDGGAPWDIKVERITDDTPASNYQDDLYWLAYTEVVDSRFSWPNIAGARLTFDAESFGGNVPTRSYDYMGLIVKVPANYDSYNRTYTGIWNGTFKDDWTDNPAWIFYDLLTNKRYGLGDNIDAAQIDKYALYQIAQYCDELVDAPNGEQEPRYTCSCVINTQSEAYELLTAIASAFRGMIYHSGGMITPVADMPSDPVLNVGPANVIDGTFTYQGASRKARHTVARVSWNNPDDGYKLNVELYEDDEAIRKYGYRPIDINAFGCTSRGLARRWGKWSIVSDNDAPDTVTYKAGFDHFKLRPGDVINIADPNYSGEQLFGLIADVTDNVSPATHTITLDRAVTRIAGDTSELQLTLADGTILALDVTVLTNTTSAEITVDSSALTTVPLAGASWLLKKGTVEPRQWRVISISEDEPNIYQVTAMLYDPNKYDSIETGLNFAEADFTAFPSGPLAAPTGLAISEFLKQTGSAILECATFSWVRPDDARAELFEMQYQEDGKDWQATTPNLTGVTSVDIINIVPGTYNFRVRTQDSSGIFRSEWATLASQTLQGKNKAPEDVTGFTASVEKFGVLLSWNKVSDIDIDYYEIRVGASWAAGTPIAKVKATTFKYEDATTGAYTFWIKALDTQTPANESATAASTSVTVSAQAAPSVVATAVNGGIQLTISGVTSRGFKAYEIQRREAPAKAESTINSNVLTKIFTDSDITTLGYVKSWQYRVRALDQNGSASAWSDFTTATTPKQIENDDITANQIIGKDFRTACNVGNGSVSGLWFNSCAIRGYNGATMNFCLSATDGTLYAQNACLSGTISATLGAIGGYTIGATRLTAGSGACGVGMSSNTDCPAFYAGCTTGGSAPFRVTHSGAVTATSGSIAGLTLASGSMTATNLGVYCGAANAARVQVGTGSCVAGLNAADGGTDIAMWAGCCHACRTKAPFRVTAAGAVTATSGTIGGWTLGAAAITAGNLALNCAGSITGCYSAGTSGWCIGADGSAEFNDVVARGTFIGDISTECGILGGLCFCDGMGMFSGTGATRIQVDPATGLWLGATAYGDAPFRVSRAGVAYFGSSVGICCASPSYALDVTGTINGTCVLQAGNPVYATQTFSAAVNTGWVTIAHNTGSRASASFFVRDTKAYHHSSTHFVAQHHYGTGNNIDVLARGTYGNTGAIRAIRIVDGSTYDGAVLQICVGADDSCVAVFMDQNYQSSGWVLKCFEATECGLSNVAAQVDLACNGPMHSGNVYINCCSVAGIALGSTCVCSPIVCGSTCAISPIMIGSTCACSPILLGSTCACSPIVCGSTCVIGGVVCGSTCVKSPTICATTLINVQGGTASTVYANIGGTSNGTLTVRHLRGKASAADAAGDLFLNYYTSDHVVAGYGGGNVSIGTCITPTFKLDVCGTAQFTTCVQTPFVYASTCLGVGVASPSAPLHVYGDCAIIGTAGTDCAKSLFLCRSTGHSWEIRNCTGILSFWGGHNTANCLRADISSAGVLGVCVCLTSPVLCASTCARGAILCGTTCAQSPILCSTSCVRTPLVESPNFMSGLVGWRIDQAGNAEFNNAAIRGELRSAVFVYDEISAVGGQAYIASAETLLTCATTPAAVNSCYTICTEGAKSVHAAMLAASDTIRMKTFDGTNVYDAWGCVVPGTILDCTTYFAYCVKHLSGSCSATIPAGTAVISYGQAGSTGGGIWLNGQGNCSPHMDIFTTPASPWNGLCGRVRLGNLAGIAGFSCCGYGLWTDNGVIVGGVVQSNNWCASAGSCFDLACGCFALGGSSSPSLCWNGTNLGITGCLTVDSQLPLDMPGGEFGHWPAGDASTASIALACGVQDISGYGLHGSSDCGTCIVPDSRFGNVYEFDGTNDTISTSAQFWSGVDSTAPASLSAWFCHSSEQTCTAGNTIVFGQAYYGGLGVAVTAANLHGWFRNSCAACCTALSYDKNCWHHIALVYGGCDCSCFYTYLDGVLVCARAITQGDFTKDLTNYCVRLGYGTGGGAGFTFYKGRIYDPRAYNRLITAEQVKTLYLLGKNAASGTVCAERVITGCLKSQNWAAGAGSLFDLNCGTFCLGGSDAPKLSWDGSVLGVAGTVCAVDGCIAEWTVCGKTIYKNIGTGFIALGSTGYAPTCPSYDGSLHVSVVCNNSTCGWISIGGSLRTNAGWSIAGACMGIAVVGKGAVDLFHVISETSTGTLVSAKIAGWNFNSACLYNSCIFLNSEGGICGKYTAGSAGWCIGCDGSAEFNNVTVRGTVCASTGNIGGFCTTSVLICSTPAAGCSVGMSSCSTSGSVAFWAGCSTIASAPFRVTNLGCLTATAATVTGTICASAGCIGCWLICTGRIEKTNGWKITLGTFNNSGCVDGFSVFGGNKFRIQLANCVFDGSTFICHSGLVIRNAAGAVLLRSTNCSTDATGECHLIAGWSINSGCLSSAGDCIIMNAAGAISGAYSAGCSGWCISCDGSAELNNVTARGTVCSACGEIGGWSIGTGRISSCNAGWCVSLGRYANNAARPLGLVIDDGTYMRIMISGDCINTGSSNVCHSGMVIRNSAGGVVFRATGCTTGGGDCGILAGWDFNTCCLSAGCLVLNCAGSIAGAWAGSGCAAGWCVNSGGCAEFNNVTVRGTVCACGGGNIGGFVIGTNMLCSTPAAGCSVGMSSCATTGAIAFWAGCSTVASAPFRVTNTGTIYACCGYIGAFQLVGGYFVACFSGDTTAMLLSDISGTPANTKITNRAVCVYNNSNSLTHMTCSYVLTECCSGLLRYYAYMSRYGFWSGATNNSIGICSCFWYNNTVDGNTVGTAPMNIIMAGGTSCYAMCVSGRINIVGGVTCVSDQNMKTDIQDINVLHTLRQMPITMWRFKDSKDYHIGPMAQDFNKAFRLAHDWQTNLTVGGLDGIALKAVKEVDENVQKLEKDNAAIRLKLQKLECEMAALREMIN